MEMISIIAAQKSKSLSPRSGSKYVPVKMDVDGEGDEDDFIDITHKQQQQQKQLQEMRDIQHPIPIESEIVVNDRIYEEGATISTINSCSFYRNRYNILRIIMLFITLLFISICFLYGFGQILSLQLDDYFCEPKSLEDIHKHSIENNLNHGTNEECWTTSNNKVDQEKLFYAGSYVAYQSIWNINTFNIIKCVLFMIIAIYLIIVFIIFILKTCNDCSRFWKRNWDRNNSIHSKDKSKENIFSKINTSRLMNKWLILKHKYYDDHFAMHTTYWVIKMIIRETLEIIIQLIVFLQYGGYQNTFLYIFYSSNKLISAESKQYVMLFAMFLCGNCVLTGLLWILYLYKKNISCIKEGKFFGHIVFMVDAIFDTFYSIFPLMLLGHNISFKIAAAALNSNSFLTFISVYYPLLFLSIKISIILNYCTFKCREEWKSKASSSFNVIQNKLSNIPSGPEQSQQIEEIEEIEQTPQETEKNKFDDKNKCCVCCKLLFDGSYLDYNISETYGSYVCYGYIIQFIRRLILGFWSIILIGIGIIIIIASMNHFNKMEYLCSNPNDEEIKSFPELLIWDSCNYKVYPFFTDNNPCNCRGFVMSKNDIFELNQNVIESLLEHWYMLEVFKLEGSELLISIDLTAKQLQSKNMRVFYIDSISIKSIDDLFGINWMNLEFLVFKSTFTRNSELVLPNSTSLLHKIQYLDLSYNLYLQDSIINIICNLKNLKVLIFTLSSISEIPDCLIYFEELKYIDMTGASGTNLDIRLLNLPNLNEFLFLNSALTEHSFIGYENNETKQFDYNKDTIFGWQGSKLCWNYDGDTNITYNNTKIPWNDVKDIYYPYLWKFLNETRSCEYYCKYYTVFDFGPGVCLSSQWNNGICDQQCNTLICYYDGMDCNQLCQCNLTLLTNNQCDIQCNTTQCNWDQYECIESNQINNYYLMDNYTECLNKTLCKRDWIGDTICDENCRYNICDFDEEDCTICDGICKTLWEDYFLIFANAITTDYQIDQEEACNLLWPLLTLVNNNVHPIFTNYNCTSIIPRFDYDDNGKLSGHEILDLVLIASGKYDRIGEVNCSICADNIQQYMHGQ